jgi:hypothetical protein
MQLPIILRSADAQRATFLLWGQLKKHQEHFYIGRVTIQPSEHQSQSLKEAKAKIPEEYHKHTKIFSKQDSQRLPAHSIWDHAIELLPGAPSTLPG